MTDMVKYVFGLIGALVASLLIFAWFMSTQSTMYTTMDNQLAKEYLSHTGNNGELTNDIVNQSWDEYKTGHTQFIYNAYKEGA